MQTLVNKFNTVKFKVPGINGFFSVVIPVYKDVGGLKDTLESLRKQTLLQSNYEIIVSNDGADSKISELCKEYKVKEVGISPNKGSYHARNKALEVSRGEFLAFTDADVIVPNDWLERGLHALKKYDYVCAPVKFTQKKNSTLSEVWENIFEFNYEYSFNNDHYGVTANLFLKRNVIELLGGFDTRLQSGGDLEFGNRVYLSSLTQSLDKTNSVLHPHRNYREVIKKKKRVAQGINDIVELFPQRFEHYRYVLFDEFIQLIIPPKNYFQNIKLFLFLWHLKFIDIYINLKYRHQGMSFFHRKSIIYSFWKFK